MKAIVLYTSISGFTKKYAEWISLELNAECVDLAKAGKIEIAAYDLIVYGGSLHAVGINGFKKFRKISGSIPGNKIIVFAVGASAKKAGIEDEIRKGNFSGGEDDAIKLFYLRGGYDYSKLDAGNKFLMTLLELKIRMKKKQDE